MAVERGGNKSHGTKQVYALEAITTEIPELLLERFLLLPPLAQLCQLSILRQPLLHPYYNCGYRMKC
jgi:hypothetical protein